MKKLFLFAAVSVAGLASAKDVEIKKLSTDGEKKEAVKSTVSKEIEAKMNCISYGMYIECTGEVIPDTVCYGEGTGTATYQDAWNCITENGTLANDYFCG